MTEQRCGAAANRRQSQRSRRALIIALVATGSVVLAGATTVARAACLPSQCGDTSAVHGAQRADEPASFAQRSGDSAPDNTVRLTLRDPGPGTVCLETGVRAAVGCTELDLPQPLRRE
jgi:hypothetical protein